MSFRDAIASYLQEKPWTRLGLDILLGQPTDDLIDAASVQFLPDFLMLQFTDAKTLPEEVPIIEEKFTLLSFNSSSSPSFIWSPTIWLWLLALLVLSYTYWGYKRQKSSQWLNVLIFSTTTILGALITFLWFFTEHTVTGPNWHILWANPFHILLVYPFFQRASIVRVIKVLLILPIVLTLLLFPFFPQYMPPVLWPFWLILAIRIAFYRTKKATIIEQ
jgi:hypothetical protein